MVVEEYKSKERPPVFTFMYGSEFIICEFLLSSISPERQYPIFYNHHSIKEIPLNTKYIFYNTEQLTRDCEKRDVLNMIKTYPQIVEIWDYSEVNCEILKKEGIGNIKYVPFTLTPYLRSFYSPLVHKQKKYDIGFCGSDSQRRLHILDKLREKGFTVHYINKVYMWNRDIELSKCKVLLNIHYGEDFHVFETARCEAWLSVGYPLISEISADPDVRCIANVPYDRLVETVTKYLTE